MFSGLEQIQKELDENMEKKNLILNSSLFKEKVIFLFKECLSAATLNDLSLSEIWKIALNIAEVSFYYGYKEGKKESETKFLESMLIKDKND